MRHAIYKSTEGKHWLCQVLLFTLLQGLLCSGRVVLVRQEQGSFPRMWLLRDPESPQKDQAKMVSTPPTPHSTTTTAGSPLPVLRDLAFLPREESNEPHGRYNPIFVNISRETNSSLDYKIWKALLTKVSHTPRGAPTSQLPVPHLERLGFGASNKMNTKAPSSRTVHHPTGDNVHITEHLENTEHSGQDLRKLVYLGMGSFMGGISVVLCLLLVLMIRKRCRRPDVNPTNVEAGAADPTLTLITNEEPIDVSNSLKNASNEYSTTSYSSTSSGIGDMSSNTSDNASNSSEYGEVWTTPPNQIALSSMRHPDRQRSNSVFEQLSNNNEIRHEEERQLLDPVPDLLLSNSLLDFQSPRSPHVEHVSEEGGIIMPKDSDIVLVVPPGAVNSPEMITVKVHSTKEYPKIRNTPDELVISPIVEVSTNSVEYFANALTIKLPYRNLPCPGPCLCEDDPLCSCAGTRVELRYCDKPTSECSAWRRALSPAVGGCYVWPECFSPENIQTQEKTSCKDFRNALVNRLQRRNSSVSYKCSDSSCQIQTNVPGLYGLVWIPRKRHGSLEQYSGIQMNKSQSSPSTQVSPVQMCATVSCGFTKQVNAGGVVYDSDVRPGTRKTYTVHITDNTKDSKQVLLSDIERSGQLMASSFIPLDISGGSSVSVLLASAHDPTWPCTIHQAESYKRIPWTSLCRDFGSPTTVDFPCAPKNDEAFLTRSEVKSVFDIAIVESCREETKLVSKRLVACDTLK